MVKVLVFGTGRNYKKIQSCFREEIQIVAFVDNDGTKWGKEIEGIEVISPNIIDEIDYDYLVIAVQHFMDVEKQLFEMEIEHNKIISPFRYDHSQYRQWRNIFNIEELIYLEMNEKISGLYTYINNLEYELASKIKNNRLRYPKVLGWRKTIEEIVDKRKSISRYGDGEFDIILGRDNTFQTCDEELIIRLRDILKSNLENHIVAIPDAYGDFVNRTPEFIDCFRKHFENGGRETEYSLLDMEKEYYDAFITRPYHDFVDKSEAREKFSLFKKVWENRDLTIVEGEKSRLGVGNDLFVKAKSCVRILCPSLNAFEKYEEILNAVLATDKDRLVLIALGATATVLAYDLAQHGYQALDVGHIDIEYEWYQRGSQDKVAIEGKYVNEAPDGKKVSDECVGESYYEEIIKIIH